MKDKLARTLDKIISYLIGVFTLVVTAAIFGLLAKLLVISFRLGWTIL